MFSSHVSEQLSAYCHGELDVNASRQVAEHLIGCSSCRVEYEEIKVGVKVAERLPLVEAPDSLWTELETRLQQQDSGKQQPVRPATKFRVRLFNPITVGVAAGLVLTLGLASLWIYLQESRPSWEVARLVGAPMIGSSRIGQKGQLGRRAMAGNRRRFASENQRCFDRPGRNRSKHSGSATGNPGDRTPA